MIPIFREPFLSRTDNLPCFMPSSVSQHCVNLSYPVSWWLPTTIQSSATQVSFSEWSVLEKRKPGSWNLNQYNLITEGFCFSSSIIWWLGPHPDIWDSRRYPYYSHPQTRKHCTDPAKQRPVGRKVKCLIPLYDNKDFCHKVIVFTSIYHLEMYQTSWYRKKYPQIMVDGLIKPHSAKWVGKDFLCIQR